ncbi:MAG TPA: HIT domain-containing protein [Candidatus Dormibacteraeota bacterium]|nr:HIT domain-containing protein [Candidatus Dormibacteraeota bacterium]
MDRLWAPWRMQYIAGPPKPGCLFERVLEHPDDEDAQLVVWRPSGALVLLNKFPYNPGHAMVAPRAHKAGLEDLADDEALDVMRALRRTVSVLRSVMNPDGFNVGVNMGREAGAGIPDHVHFHVVPRWNGDTNFMPVLDDVKVVNEALAQTADKLKRAFDAT